MKHLSQFTEKFFGTQKAVSSNAEAPTPQAVSPGKQYANPKVRKTIFGRKYWVPVIEKMGDPLKETQPELFAVMQNVYSIRDGAFLDIGANVGQTLVKLRAIRPDIPYFGFEVNVYACFFVQQFLQMNRDLEGCVLFPFALSNKTGVVKLFRRGLVGSGASIVEAQREMHQEYKHKDPVFCIDGDQVVPSLDIPELALIKIDVEGGELEVLQGLEQTIRQYRPYLISELQPIHDTRTNESNDNATFRNKRRAEIEGLMARLDYITFLIEADGSLTNVSAMKNNETSTRDYLFVPRERKDEIATLL